MSLLNKLLFIWYSGLGEILVCATCPLIVGGWLFLLLQLLQGWQRPARLWARIRLIRPVRWIIMMLVCSLISFAYIRSLQVLRHTSLLSQMLHPEGDWAGVHLVLLFWLAIVGGAIITGNVIPVLRILIDALCSKGIWLTLRCEWTDEAEMGWRKTFTGQVCIYDDGTYETVGEDKEQGSFLLKRDRDGRWKIIAPQSLPVQEEPYRIVIRRPAVRRVEHIRPGEWRFIQEGDVLTFAGNERWYILVEKLYP